MAPQMEKRTMTTWMLCVFSLFVVLPRAGNALNVLQLKSNAITTLNSGPNAATSPHRDRSSRTRRSVFDGATERLLVDKHNDLRRRPPASDMQQLVWNEELASMAEDWARQCRWEHGQPSRPAAALPFHQIGQNLYSSNGTFDPVGAVQMWYDEVAYYDHETGHCSKPPCGHYTQVVWSGSRELGCAYARCPTMLKSEMVNATYLVCNYGPTGNYVGLKPYAVGRPCTACQSGRFWCDDGLCRPDCDRQSTRCTCQALCQNCGRTDVQNCSCSCADGWHGADCSERCLDTHKYCGANPGWPLFWCNVTYVRHYCPRMCGLCVEWTADRELHCRESNSPPPPLGMTVIKNSMAETPNIVTVAVGTPSYASATITSNSNQINKSVDNNTHNNTQTTDMINSNISNEAADSKYRNKVFLYVIPAVALKFYHRI